eukprot:1821130-Amphidinium_carterae.1
MVAGERVQKVGRTAQNIEARCSKIQSELGADLGVDVDVTLHSVRTLGMQQAIAVEREVKKRLKESRWTGSKKYSTELFVVDIQPVVDAVVVAG